MAASLSLIAVILGPAAGLAGKRYGPSILWTSAGQAKQSPLPCFLSSQDAEDVTDTLAFFTDYLDPEDLPSLTHVYVGNQIPSDAWRQPGTQALMKCLTEASTSSGTYVLPYTYTHKVPECGQSVSIFQKGGQTLNNIKVLCSPFLSAKSADRLEQEVALLKALLKDLQATEFSLLYIHSAPESVGTPGIASTRSLHAVSGNERVCGPKCKAQVRWMEGIIVGVLLAFIGITGLGCQYALNTPTRFQTPQEGTRGES